MQYVSHFGFKTAGKFNILIDNTAAMDLSRKLSQGLSCSIMYSITINVVGGKRPKIASRALGRLSPSKVGTSTALVTRVPRDGRQSDHGYSKAEIEEWEAKMRANVGINLTKRATTR